MDAGRPPPQLPSDGCRLPEHRERGPSQRFALGARSRCWNEHRLRSRKQVSQEGSARGFHESRVGKFGGPREVGTQVQATFGASRLFGHVVVVRPSFLRGLRARRSHRHRRLGAGPVQCSRIRCLASRWRRLLTRRRRGLLLHPQRGTWVARLIDPLGMCPEHWPTPRASRQGLLVVTLLVREHGFTHGGHDSCPKPLPRRSRSGQ
jgi:hypothetical protein